jgi:hypothetical protein
MFRRSKLSREEAIFVGDGVFQTARVASGECMRYVFICNQ